MSGRSVAGPHPTVGLLLAALVACLPITDRIGGGTTWARGVDRIGAGAT